MIFFPVENKTEWATSDLKTSYQPEFERLICASGPTGGHMVRPSDGVAEGRIPPLCRFKR